MHVFECEAYTIHYRKGRSWNGERFLDTQIRTEFIVDFHTHLMVDPNGKLLDDEQRRRFKERYGYWIPFEATPREQVKIMRNEGISKAVIFDAGSPTLREAWEINHWITSIVTKYPELIGFAIAPTDGSEGTDELLDVSIKNLN